MADPLVEALLERYSRPAESALGLAGELRRPDLVNALAQPSTADVMAQYREPQWGGLKSYLPDQPEWMKTAQEYLGRGLAAIPPEAQFALNFLGRAPVPRAPSRLTPAVSVDGAVFARGPTHSQALDEWALRRGRELSDADLNAIFDNEGRMVMGYTTPDGVFLNRQEAQRHIGLPETWYGLESRNARRRGYDVR